ncbi:uncharacterized protein LOC111914537 isoform X1 [Lactuca sativa]|uniref:uncharacterized protein LOC111914537 isoform X1 n=1 Tax=Lactuca sativa TaxID=4236 RepID=UPI000CAB8126|nr:uncharacterized protein LOC111914537 isoform X1 [Lactuca sativa]
MASNLVHGVYQHHRRLIPPHQCFNFHHGRTSINVNTVSSNLKQFITLRRQIRVPRSPPVIRRFTTISASLDLTEDNVKLVLDDARTKFSHLFDASVGMTGVAELAEVDGPFVKIRLKGRFWHERSLVLARLGNYLKERIPEILEVDIEDEKQLDDSPENF